MRDDAGWFVDRGHGAGWNATFLLFADTDKVTDLPKVQENKWQRWVEKVNWRTGCEFPKSNRIRFYPT